MSSNCITCTKRPAKWVEKHNPRNAFCDKLCQFQYHRIGLSGRGDTVVGLEAADGTRIEIELDDARKMRTIEYLLEDAGTKDYIPLPNIDGATLLRIQQFLNENEVGPMSDEEFYSLLKAANYLDFQELLHFMYLEWVNSRDFPGPSEKRPLMEDAVVYYSTGDVMDLDISDELKNEISQFISRYGNDMWQFFFAAYKGNYYYVKEMIADDNFDPEVQGDLAVILAARNGHLEVVKLLAKAYGTRRHWIPLALREAAWSGHTDVVDFLAAMLQDDDDEIWNEALQYAMYPLFPNYDVITRLLQDKRFKIDTDTVLAIGESEEIKLVRLFLQDGKLDPSSDRNLILRMAAKLGKLDIVKFLVSSYKNVNPGDADNFAVIVAAENGHLDVVEYLLNDPRVDPSDQYNDALISAAQRRHYDVVERLLQDERVNVDALRRFVKRDERIRQLYEQYTQKRQRIRSRYK